MKLRYDSMRGTLGASMTNATTTVTFASALTYRGGSAVPTIVSPDYIALIVKDQTTDVITEIMYLTTYTQGATTGTVLRAQEGSSAVAHASGDKYVVGPTASDFQPGSWHSIGGNGEPAFLNGWGNYGNGWQTVGFRRRADSVVELRGSGKPGSAATAMFTLPVGYRPALLRGYATLTAGGGSFYFGGVAVYGDGTVLVNSTSGSFISLDGITFAAEQ